MALRAVPIHRAGNRVTLFMGGDRELVMFSGLIAGVLIFATQDFQSAVFGLFLWFVALFVFRNLAKADPRMRQVYMRWLRYKRYYPARSTPYRENTNDQVKVYK